MNIQRKNTENLDTATVSEPASEDVCRVLSVILADGVDIHRCLAAKALGRIGAPMVVEPLTGALLDEDEDVRTDAAEALSTMADSQMDPRAAKQLFENLLGDPCTEVKLAAIETLAKLGEESLVPWLRRLVKERDEEIVWDEEEFYASGWDDWVDIQIKAVKALADMNITDAVPDIVAAMQDEYAQDMTETAFKALACMGEPGIKALADFLGEEDTRLRRRAATALAGIDSDIAAALVTRALEDTSPEVRAAAMRALAARVPIDPRLAACLADADASIRAEAVQLFGQYHSDHLPALLGDASEPVQMAALTLLAGTGELAVDASLAVTLRAMLEGASGGIAAAAARAFAVIDPEAAVSDLVHILGDTERGDDIRVGALQGLAAAGGEMAVDALIGVINDEARSVRLESMTALARLAGADAVWPNAAGEALLDALRGGHDPEPSEEDEDPVPAKTEPAPEIATVDPVAGEDDEDPDVFPTSTMDAMLKDTPEVGKALGLPEQGIELTPADMERLALARNIKGKRRMAMAPTIVRHEDIRRFAARILGDLTHADVARELAAALHSDDGEVRLAAADSLARIGERMAPLPRAVMECVMVVMAKADRDMRLLLIRALAATEGGPVVDLLNACLDDADSFIRAEAVRALAKLGRTGPQIEPLLGDADSSVRLCAAEAIAGTGGGNAVELLVNLAFAFEGFHARPAARLLRGLDAARANTLFIDVLEDEERKRVWSVAIEALEELNLSQLVPASAAMDQERLG